MGVLITRPSTKKWDVVDNNHDVQYQGVGRRGVTSKLSNLVAVGVHVKLEGALLFCLLLFRNCLIGKMCGFSNSVLYSFPVLYTFVTS